jgi:hypothetical protein
MPFLLILSLLAAWPASAADSVRLLVQRVPLAGSQYYALAEQGPQLQVGDWLNLVREADNRHDRHAIRVDWRGHRLGYLPRQANQAVAAAMDRGERLRGRIAGLRHAVDPWQRVDIEVYVEL